MARLRHISTRMSTTLQDAVQPRGDARSSYSRVNAPGGDDDDAGHAPFLDSGEACLPRDALPPRKPLARSASAPQRSMPLQRAPSAKALENRPRRADSLVAVGINSDDADALAGDAAGAAGSSDNGSDAQGGAEASRRSSLWRLGRGSSSAEDDVAAGEAGESSRSALRISGAERAAPRAGWTADDAV